MNIHDATEQAYQNGYQQGKEDAAREIFEKIAKITRKYCDDAGYSTCEMMYDFAKLEKKYTEGEK